MKTLFEQVQDFRLFVLGPQVNETNQAQNDADMALIKALIKWECETAHNQSLLEREPVDES